MSDEGTQKPTPKRIKEFRDRGEIAHSKDLTTVAALAGGAIATMMYIGQSTDAIAAFARRSTAAADGRLLDGSIVPAMVHTFFAAAGPTIVGAAGAALIVGLLQLGFPPAFRMPKIDFSRAVPGPGLLEAFNPKSAARRLGLAVGKIAAVAFIVVLIIRKELTHDLDVTSPQNIASRIGSAVGRLATAAGFVLVLFAAIDYYLSKRRIDSKMKMTPDAIKREHREQEGDPLIKAKRRRKARQLASRRLVKEVKSADVIVVNPTHYAVALRYRADKDAAPTVVAKGVDELAMKIRDLARSAGIPILSRPPLARALHKLPEGAAVPSAMFRAVAEVLAYVYRLRNRGGPVTTKNGARR